MESLRLPNVLTPARCLAAVNGSYVADPLQTAATGFSDPYPFLAGGHLGQFFNPAVPFAYVASPHFRTPYAYNYNYGLQYQLPRTTMVEAVYVGNASRKAIGMNETNFASLYGPNGLLAQYNYAIANQLDPVFSINVDCARLLAACTGGSPAFTGSPSGATQIYTNLSNANSSSNQFQLTVDKQASHGLQFRVAYMLSKTIDASSGFRARTSTYTDPTNPAFDRGLADFDARHRLVISPIWRLP